PSTTARGRGRTISLSYPQDAASPSSPGVTGVPTGSSSSPALASSPGSRHSGRSRGSPRTRPSVTVASSTRTIAVVPAGTIAPVAISTQVPSAPSGSAGWPASTRPVRRHGPAPRTAKPSTLEVGNAGRSVRATSGSASARPSASGSGTGTGGGAASRPAAQAAVPAASHGMALTRPG